MIYAILVTTSGMDGSAIKMCLQFRDEDQLTLYEEAYAFDNLIKPIDDILQDGHYVGDVIEINSVLYTSPDRIDLDVSNWE